ncbi:bifunctional DNA primase/polymerase [Pyruvatibacter sp.]
MSRIHQINRCEELASSELFADSRRFFDNAEPAARNGYAVIPIQQGTKIPAVSGWPSWETQPQTPRLLDDWAGEFAQSGLGLVLGWNGLMAFDIDVHDQSMVDEIVDQIEDLCGPSPLKRVGNAPKIALFYRFEGQQPGNGRQVISLGELGQVEVFTSGRQMVAFNTHPDTGRPYEWIGSGDPATVSVSELPAIDEDLYRTVLGQLSKELTGDELEVSPSASVHPAAQYVRDPASGLVVENRDALLSSLCFAELSREYARYGDLAVLQDLAESIARSAFDRFQTEVQTTANKKGRGLPWTKQDALEKVRQKLRRAVAVGADQFFQVSSGPVSVWSTDQQSMISCSEAEAALESCFNELVESAVVSGQHRARWEESLLSAHEGQIDPGSVVMPPIAQQSLVKVTTGVGKSTAARKAIAQFVQTMRAGDEVEGSRGDALQGNHRVLFLCARHDTAAEQRAAFDEEYGQQISSNVWYGRSAKYPSDTFPEGWRGDRMCDEQMSTYAAEASQKGGSIQQLVCSKCQFAEECPYLLQQMTADQYEVTFASHEFFVLGPHEAMGEFGLVVVDEWLGAIAGVEREAKSIVVDQLGTKLGGSQWPVLAAGADEELTGYDADASRRLEAIELELGRWIKGQAALLLASAGDSNPKAIRLRVDDLDLPEADIQKAIWWEKKRLVCRKVEYSSLSGLRSILGRMPPRSAIEARVALLQFALYTKSRSPFHLEHFGVHGASVRVANDGDLVVDIHRHRVSSHKLSSVPTIFLDATADVELLRPIAPFVRLVADLNVEAPNQHLVLYKFRTTKRRLKNDAYLDEIVQRIKDRSKDNTDCAAIVPKPFKTYFENALPHFSIHHNGAVSGLNSLSAVKYLAVVGSLRMSEEAAYEIARDNFDEMSERGRMLRAYTQSDRKGVTSLVEYRGHASERLNGIVVHTEQGSIVQGIGRARGVRRGIDNPVLIDVFAVPPLPLPGVTAVLEGIPFNGAASAELSLLDLADKYGIVPLSPAAAVDVFPTRWGSGSRNSMKQRVTRAVSRVQERSHDEADGVVTAWFEKMRPRTFWVEVEVRVPGARGPASTWLVDRSRHHNAEQSVAEIIHTTLSRNDRGAVDADLETTTRSISIL